ncbi:hypothetical protein VitviT2T_020311 [Vitis vinifera]|uniref:Disease resistance protein n=1 Tax=Vitis vinifera TaxID=29760 RepID=A0ABY9D3E6_VITVI|nr:hypothetical protein VitviT2T_020311 [Vitis vinifera]
MTSLWENRFGLECLRGLESIDIWQCHGLVSLEEQRLPCNLKHLKIENCANLQRLPNGLQSLTCLEELSLQSCPKLESFPEMGLPSMLRSLVLQKCKTLKLLPHNYNSGFLEYLEIEHCPCLISFPEAPTLVVLKSWRSENVHPSTLKRLEIWDCGQFQPISEQMLHSNTALEQLSISNYPNMKILPGFLHSLTYLYIYGCQGLVSFPERGLPTPNLRDLYINNCENLKSLSHQMQNLSSLQGLNIRNCQGLESFPECGLAPNLTSLSIRDCVTLKVPLSEWGLHRLTSLSSLYISGVCPSLASLSDDDCLLPTTLSKLFISKLDSLACLALKNLSSLERISIYRSRKPIDESFVVCAVFFPPTRYEEKNDERVQCLLGLIRLVSAIVHKHEYRQLPSLLL